MAQKEKKQVKKEVKKEEKKEVKKPVKSASAPRPKSQDQQMEDEMDIGEDLVAASDESKPFDLTPQSELSELDEIGFADSTELEAEAVDMDPEEKQKRDLLKKQ
jgi:hypothetical protein